MDKNKQAIVSETTKQLSYSYDHIRGLSTLINTFLEDSYNNVTIHQIKNDALDYQDNVHAVLELAKFTLDNIASSVSAETTKLSDI